MATIDVDEGTYRSIEFAARMAGISRGEVVARLIAETAMLPISGRDDAGENHEHGTVSIYADYAGQRTQGRFDCRTHRVDITAGPLAGKSYKTPSGAAIAVVSHYNPTVNPNRNGWDFWTLDDGSGRLLQTLR